MVKKSHNWLALDKETQELLIREYLQRTKNDNGNEEEASKVRVKKLAQEAYERSVGYGIPANAKKVYSQESIPNYKISNYSPSSQLNKFFENSVYETLKKSAPQFNSLFDYVYNTDIKEETEEAQEAQAVLNEVYQERPSEVIKKKVINLPLREEANPIKPSLERAVSPEINITKPKKVRASLDSLIDSDESFSLENYEPVFKLSKESKDSFKYGCLSGMAPVIDPLGYISSLFYRQFTGVEFKDKNSMGTVFNKIYGGVYKNKSETPYIPKALGTLSGLGIATGALVGLSFINPLLGLAIPALTGFYSIYKTIKKSFSGGSKNA